MPNICLTLPGPDPVTNISLIQSYSDVCAAFELRLDLIEVNGVLPDITDIVREMNRAAMERTGDADVRGIITLRTRADGGTFNPSIDSVSGEQPSGRQAAILNQAIQTLQAEIPAEMRKHFAVDIEDGVEMPEVFENIVGNGFVRIASVHDFSGTPENIVPILARLGENGAIAKFACMVRGMEDLVSLIKQCREFSVQYPDRRCIVAGMGEYGTITRILPEICGSCISFVCAGEPQAPGQIDGRVMNDLYRGHVAPGGSGSLEGIPVFAITGNPVAHSKSPHYHNGRFREDGTAAVYVPLRCDSPELIPELAKHMPLVGLSVTIPHKEAVRNFLVHEDDGCSATGACNTLLKTDAGWEGRNTDIAGLIFPARDAMEVVAASGRGATVVGAGGAAKSAVFALIRRGIPVLVLNRSLNRAEELVRQMSAKFPAMAENILCGGLDEEGLAAISPGHDGLIIQTTSVGMEGAAEGDPLAGYEFSGSEVVYDIIYTPERTAMLVRAEAAGCRVINGRSMFDAQAEHQSRYFTAVARAW